MKNSKRINNLNELLRITHSQNLNKKDIFKINVKLISNKKKYKNFQVHVNRLNRNKFKAIDKIIE